MNVFQLALTIGALLAAIVAWQVPRAALWIALGALSFITSTIWQKAGLPYRELFGTGTDVAIIAAIYVFGKQR